MRNPFVTNGYAGPEYSCDRIEETKAIVPQRPALGGGWCADDWRGNGGKVC